MKGYTFSLPLLLICGVLTQKPADTTPKDYFANVSALGAQQILLPTSIGTIDLTSVAGKQIGSLPTAFSKCGKTSVTQQEVGLTGINTFEMRMECLPNPMRVVVASSNAKAFSIANGELDLAKCQGLQTCATTTIFKINHGNESVTGVSNAPLNSFSDSELICDTPNNGNVLFSNEMGCENAQEVPQSDAAASAEVYIAPRWKTSSTDGLFEVIRPFTYTGLGRKNEKPSIPRTNNFVKLPPESQMKSTHEWKKCTASCDIGNIVKFNMNPAGGWKSVIYLNGKTKGFKVCIDAENHNHHTDVPKCLPRFELFILPRNGLVIWPKNGRASVLEMKSPSISDTQAYAIEFGYGYTKDDGTTTSEFYVANMFREVVLSDSDGWTREQASKVSFFFENADDLVKTAGIWSPQIETGTTYLDKSIASGVRDEKVVYQKAGINVKDGSESMVNRYEDKPLPIPATTTPAPKRLSSNIQSAMLLPQTDALNAAIFTNGKWWAWALYFGFVSGALITVAGAGAILYFLRRTAYGFWYRGMYKRYGCDASGTTGGITGVGFGTTTAGAITVGGNTTAGGGTTGTTGGTTMTTTGGKTTGGTTSGGTTGSASTIAM
uniref:Transmembrane protein n=1 Tax=Caenorhabditis tropicalis TaxID=1561998 RepID=A0A1I7U926_9PELO